MMEAFCRAPQRIAWQWTDGREQRFSSLDYLIGSVG
jgi:hypothetical protein